MCLSKLLVSSNCFSQKIHFNLLPVSFRGRCCFSPPDHNCHCHISGSVSLKLKTVKMEVKQAEWPPLWGGPQKNDHRWQTLCKRWMALTHMPCQLLFWVKLAQTHWTPGWRVEMLVSTESQQQPAITKHNINALYTSSTHFPVCKLFLCENFPTKRLCFNVRVLECTLNARETLPCAPSDVRSSWTWKWRCNVPGACQSFRPREKMSIIWHSGSLLPSYLVSQKWHLNLLSSPLWIVLCWKVF